MDFVLFNGYYGVVWSVVECLNAFYLGCIARERYFRSWGERFLPTDCRDGCELETEGWKTETGFITGYRS